MIQDPATDHLDYDPLLLSITKKRKEVRDETHKLQRELDKVQQLIKTLTDQEQALSRAINTSKAEEAALQMTYDDSRDTVLSKWNHLSQANNIDCFWYDE